MTLEIVYSRLAIADLKRLRAFIAGENPKAAQAAAQSILRTVEKISTHPLLGRQVRNKANIRDVIIPFGVRGYRLRYRVMRESIQILRIWHHRERKNTKK